MKKPSEADVAGKPVDPVPNDTTWTATRSRTSSVPRSGVEDADLVDLRSHIQELEVENEDLLACHTGNQKNQMDTLLMLCIEKKMRGALKLELRRLAQELANFRAAQR